jgi:putative FmdB family regulatory protein
MPIYEYSCNKCGEVIERIQKFSDPPLKKHSGCGGTLTKLISQSAFQLKGTGWYVTDYANKGTDKKKAGEGESAGSDQGDKKADKAEKETKDTKDKSPKKERSGSDK